MKRCHSIINKIILKFDYSYIFYICVYAMILSHSGGIYQMDMNIAFIHLIILKNIIRIRFFIYEILTFLHDT